MSVDTVNIGEFNRAIERLSREVVAGNQTATHILAEAKITNGRVRTLERDHAMIGAKLESLKERVDESDPLTKRDLYVALGVLAAVGGLVTWLLNIVQAAGIK